MSGLLISTWGGLALMAWRWARRGVAVVDGRGQERGGQGGVQFLQGLELVLLQGLQGEKIEGVAAVVQQEASSTGRL